MSAQLSPHILIAPGVRCVECQRLRANDYGLRWRNDKLQHSALLSSYVEPHEPVLEPTVRRHTGRVVKRQTPSFNGGGWSQHSCETCIETREWTKVKHRVWAYSVDLVLPCGTVHQIHGEACSEHLPKVGDVVPVLAKLEHWHDSLDGRLTWWSIDAARADLTKAAASATSVTPVTDSDLTFIQVPTMSVTVRRCPELLAEVKS